MVSSSVFKINCASCGADYSLTSLEEIQPIYCAYCADTLPEDAIEDTLGNWTENEWEQLVADEWLEEDGDK
jgi:formate hydrogenlyase subunit 6/NADH:ubiquinone oxidoreductase subunit I